MNINEYSRNRLNGIQVNRCLSTLKNQFMSLSDYLVNCGGLMGLWFGTSAKDIITFIINSEIFNQLTRLFQ